MVKQSELDFREPQTRAKAGPKLAARMIAVLSVRKGWTTRATLAAEHGFSRDGRECRLGRACSHGRILRGQKGYKLTKLATPEEFATSQAAWAAQIKAEQKQCSREALRWHRGRSGR